MAYSFQTTPYAHQKEVLESSWNETVWAYFLEMGTGKSKICIDNAAILFERGEIDTLIVIAPKGVYRNWARIEVPEHLPERIERDLAVWRPSPNKSEKKALTDLLEPSEALKILIMNVEALSTAKGQRFLEALLKATTAMLAVDESTTIKSPKARRTKTLLKLGALARYRRILTGFPVTQSPMDLWAQARFLDERLLGDCGDNYYQFQYRYAVMKKRTMGSHTFNQVVGYRNLDTLSELIGKFSSRILKEECLDLPPKVYLRRNVTLTDDQARIYMQLKEYALAHLDNDEFMTTPNVLTQLLRMQQVLSGHTMSSEGNLFEIKDNRLSELQDCLDEMDGKTIIWSRFRYDVKRITEALSTDHGPESVVSYFGDTSDDERTQAIESFQNGEARFFVGNPQTGGMGITLTAAQNVIYFANSFDLAIRTQSEDRAHRIGQEKSVTYVDLIAEGTIDEKIVTALRSKMDIATKVMGEDIKQWL
jgi:SNF2 family DNA or RNA helicase|tara:strand:- start:714 stop:2150 length:1437 start_codon:yes stop_codon:yes gene_type:complete